MPGAEIKVKDLPTFNKIYLLFMLHGKRADDGGVEERERKGKPALVINRKGFGRNRKS